MTIAPSMLVSRRAVPPVTAFLRDCHARFEADDGGAVADYIPELTRADPEHFGICVATIDGHVHEAGDATVPFTIQSISKAFVFALALELVGEDAVHATIGVEPSGEAFNSIRLRADKRPFNAMVNAGAIACSGLIHRVEAAAAFERIRTFFCRCAGRDLGIDDDVFRSEQATGDRNRAIAWLLRSNGLVTGDVEEVLSVYFRQCSIIVTARDLAIMGATLANSGTNPVTGESVCSPETVARTLSVMTSSGMYDFAGEWVYRVGLPAKSGVGGGIVASLPGQLGLGTFSPRLDEVGNSVRGLRVCEALSAHFGLHMLARSQDVRSAVSADYDVRHITSARHRQPGEQRLLEEHADEIRVVELSGALNFLSADYFSRLVLGDPTPRQIVVIDLRRVSATSLAAAKVFARTLQSLHDLGTTPVLAGHDPAGSVWCAFNAELCQSFSVQRFGGLDEALEWAENHIIARHGGACRLGEAVPLSDQPLLRGLKAGDLAAVEELVAPRRFAPGDRIIEKGDEATAVYFLTRGAVSIRLANGTRLATMVPGDAFGELSLLAPKRTADAWADTEVECLELSIHRFREFEDERPALAQRIMVNLAGALAERLRRTNEKLRVLSEI